MGYYVHYKEPGKRKAVAGPFAKRQQARQWCRNRYVIAPPLTIEHPDGRMEPFVYTGVCPGARPLKERKV